MFVIFFGVFAILYAAPEKSGILRLQLQWLWIRIWTPENFNVWTINYSSQEQEVTWRFNDYFRVEDLDSRMTGHYTTIQCDGLYATWWYSLTWIYLKYGNLNPTLIYGQTWVVSISNFLSGYQSITNPITYIYKSTSWGNIWVVNRYGDKPYVKIIIPAYSNTWDYSGTITFSLYMN